MVRPNKIGWVISGFFLAGGIAFTIAIPEIFIGQIWIAVSLGLMLLYGWLNRRADRLTRFRGTATAGTATILEMTQTGMYVNAMPRVKLRLRVEIPGVSPYEVTKAVTVPHIALGSLAVGRPVRVYVDPSNHRKVMVDLLGGAAPITVERSDGGGPVSITDPAVQGDIVDALREHGFDPGMGSIDLRQAGAAREAVLGVLRRHGVDAAHAAAAADPSTPVESSEEPVDRLTKLLQLRTANLITPEEYNEHRKRILEDI